MSVARTLVAVSLDQDRLCAVCAAVSNDRVKVRSWLSAQMPTGADARDPEVVGRWIGAELENAGMPRARLVFAVPRSEVVLKRMKLPRGEGEAELAGMVRLQLTRQLTMAIEGTAIDYAPLEVQGEGATASAVVLAGALPGERLAWVRTMASAAGMKLERVGLRAAGVSALLADASSRRKAPVLGVALGWGSIEFVVVDAGQLVFGRSADIGLHSQGGEGATVGALVERIAVEAKRTWMSYRAGQDAGDIAAVAVLGEGPLAQEVGAACGAAMEMPWESVGLPESVELRRDMPEAERLVAAPLVGLLGERILGRPSLDFAHPRRAPDLGAARRQKVLLGAFGAIVVGGLFWLWSDGRLGTLRADVAAAGERRAKLSEQYTEFLLQEARLRHMEQWTSAGANWPAHVRWLSDQMPDPREAQLDQLRGRLESGVVFTPKDGAYAGGTWAVRQRAVVSMDGHVKLRDVANGLRGRLVQTREYEVESKGADEPNRFSFDLTTQAPIPVREKPPPAKTAGAKDKGTQVSKGGGP